jgi:hypothetical protein
MSTPLEGPPELLEAARRLLTDKDPTSAGLWPRATAMLGRQALEGSLAELWRSLAPGLEEASFKTQFLCLPAFLGNKDALAGRVNHVWWSLTRVCHYNVYRLSPTVEELTDWLETIEQFGKEVRTILANRLARGEARSLELKRPA